MPDKHKKWHWLKIKKKKTCSIDYFLLGIWLSTKLSEKVKIFLADSSEFEKFGL